LKLIAWFIKDEQAAQKVAIEWRRGIMLVGPVGCGKTSLMNLCRFLLAADKRHTIKSCRETTFEFIKEGYEIFHSLYKRVFLSPRLRALNILL
jgi:ABC-type lipoprotein export system ATPase subunit